MSEKQDMPGAYRCILFCTDFSADASHAFGFAVDAARRRPGCRLCLLHVIPEPEAQFWKTYIYELDDIDAKARADIDRKIAEDYTPRVPSGVDLECIMRVGRPRAVILQVAEEEEAELIVMGRQGHGALGTVLFGSVIEAVVRKARCPVLVVPHQRADGDA